MAYPLVLLFATGGQLFSFPFAGSEKVVSEGGADSAAKRRSPEGSKLSGVHTSR